MNGTASAKYTPPWAQPYDPADSPGPIGSVLERFRRGRPEEPEPSEAEAEAARYTIVLVPPEAAEVVGYDRSDVGLRMYRGGDWDHNPGDLDEAAGIIQEACGEPISLVEHHSDLTYWTARLRELPG
ncbi:hypothetical protein [Micromonospora sp. NBC_01796]|uniref:hypothetical protein n=1 Tax=Micromonospora sp. NBC_01796 TaxID=2975987 RepID=UPI002DD95B82|nr:hypothetical protein [Micromonospora sp. NBC_01796]WSA89237.1 hypothetical protein OIE47_17470 [Micromonospora sp. NBC_01796]